MAAKPATGKSANWLEISLDLNERSRRLFNHYVY